MDITINEAKHLFDTCPIGYYLGRPIKCTLEDCEKSYFDPMHDRIVVSFWQVRKFLDEIPNQVEEMKEQIIRTVLYHEVSHVIFTNNNIRNRYTKELRIVEDERIECLTRHIYMNCDFRMMAQLLCIPTLPDQSKEAAFFRFVRMRVSPFPELNQKLNDIIRNAAEISAVNDGYYLVRNYADAVQALANEFYEKYEEWLKEQPQEEQNEQKQKTKSRKNERENNPGDEEPEDQDLDDETDEEDKEDNSGEEDNENEDENEEETEEDLDTHDDGRLDDHNDEEEEVEIEDQPEETVTDKEDEETDENDPFQDIENEWPDLSDLMDEDAFRGVFEQFSKEVGYFDGKLYSEMTEIINQRKKKNDQLGAAINSYCGTLNPMSVVTRTDYRWFTTVNRTGNIKAGTKLHFVLLIDCSGSMSSNTQKVNVFIQTLRRIAALDPDFTFDVVLVGTSVYDWPDLDKPYTAWDGTSISKAMIQKAKEAHTKIGARNYYLLLVDGCIGVAPSRSGFVAMNEPNCISITDWSNEGPINYVRTRGVCKGQFVLTHDYTEEFFNKIVDTFKKVF